MDPALQELIAEGAPDDEVGIVVRLHRGASAPAGLRLVAVFGEVATGRAARGDLARIHDDPAVASLKAPRLYTNELEIVHDAPDESDIEPAIGDVRRPDDLEETGRGSVVAIIDWGADFAHDDFRNPDGTTRLIALWDQRASGASAPYGYGRIHDRAAIDRALDSPDPFAALDYRTSLSPWHGTHVLGIAAGNGRAGGPVGIAPEADIIFCHLGRGNTDLGNSIELLEAIHFVVQRAGDLPLAINLSVGRQAGPHDATLLLERAIDWTITHRPGTAVAQSTGNYFERRCHMAGRLHETKRSRLPFEVGQRSDAPIVVETWYPGSDEFVAAVSGPDGAAAAASRGEKSPVQLADGRNVGMLYHRAFDPNNGDHLISLILRTDAPSGEWEIQITGLDVVDGRWHSWIERDAACRTCQAQFIAPAARSMSTTGSICNAMRTIAVGAYDAHDPAHALGPFSSVGPTRDGRIKPLLVAPGVRVLSCRSRASVDTPPAYIRMSGTSMAAPHVTGTLALMMQAAGCQPIAALRRTLFAALDSPDGEGPRWGYGRLAVGSAVARARALRHTHTAEPERLRESVKDGETIMTETVDAVVPSRETENKTMGTQDGLPDTPPVTPSSLLQRALDPGDPAAIVVGWPGRRLVEPLAAGDVIVRLDGTQLALIADPMLLNRRETLSKGMVTEGPFAGRYVRVAREDGALSPFARRIAGPDGFVLPETVLLRLAPESMPTEPGPGDSRPALHRGTSSPAVGVVQTRLNRIHASRISTGESGLDRCPLKVDGRFRAATEAAVRSFQHMAFSGQPDEWDGIVGARTWAMLDLWDIPASPPSNPYRPTFGESLAPIAPVVARRIVPIIVLPGIMGTRLSFPGSGMRDWEPDQTLTMIRWAISDGDKKLRALNFRSRATILNDHADPARQRRGWGALARKYYGDLLERLERDLDLGTWPCARQPGFVPTRCPVWAFGYDWRQSCSSHAGRLRGFISEVLSVEHAEQVVLVTHSMGGLVARAALPTIDSHVLGIVHCVQPSVGAVVAARRIMTGYRPSIDQDLGELLQELAAASGDEAIERLVLNAAADPEPVEVGAIEARVQAALFSDSLLTPNPIYYGRLMAGLPGAVELLPSDAAGRAEPWFRPMLPGGSIHDHYARGAWGSGGLVNPGMSAGDQSELRARIADAKTFHSALAYHVTTGVLFSNGLKTDTAFAPSSRSPEVITRGGDGTVPAFSGRCPDLAHAVFRVSFSRVDHGECFADSAFLETTVAGVDYIVRGMPALREGTRPSRDDCLVTA